MHSALRRKGPPVVARLRAAAARLGRRDETLAVFSQGLVSAGNFALTAAIARTLPMADFGLYMLVMSIVWLFIDLHVAMIAGPYVINRQKIKPHRRAVFFGSAVLHEAGLIAAGAAVAVAVAAHGAVSSSSAAAAGLAVCALLLRDQTRRFLVGHGMLRDCLTFDIAVLMLWAGGLIAGVVSGSFSLAWGFAAAAFACAVPCAAWLPRLGRLHGRPSLALRHWRLNWGIGRWMVLSGMMWSLAAYLYPWTLAAAHGTVETGLWAAALGLSSLCNVPLGGLQNHYAVRIAETGRRDLPREVTGKAVRLAALAGVFVLLFAAVGTSLTQALYGAAYAPAAPLALLMTFNLMIGTASFCVSRGLFALGRGGSDCAVNAIPLVVSGTAGVWATIAFGPVGAVASFLAANALALAVRALVLRRALLSPGRPA